MPLPSSNRVSRGIYCGRTYRRLQLLSLVLLLSACHATSYKGEPLDEALVGSGLGISQRIAGDRAPELLVLVAFSGGGTRAAALSYGVLQELAEHSVGTSRGSQRLLDEIDVISSVSGGSFTSAYFGLHGDSIFDDFEENFLRREVESDLAKGIIKPANWKTLGSDDYGRSDMAAAYYDQHIFDNKTFADMHRPGAPLVLINTTDIGTGARVAFTTAQFEVFCLDLLKYPISRAVAASSAVPGIASPISLENHGGQCEYQMPEWAVKQMAGTATTLTRARAKSWYEYSDSRKVPWIHLVDGGISDNLGLRAFYTTLSMKDTPEQIFAEYGHKNVRHILIISVNAAVKHDRPDWVSQPGIPGAASVMAAATTIQMDRYSANTIHIVRDSFDGWAETLSAKGAPVSFDFVEVHFGAVTDSGERAYLYNLPTSMELEDEPVDRLIAAGRNILRDSPDFKRFLARNPPAAAE